MAGAHSRKQLSLHKLRGQRKVEENATNGVSDQSSEDQGIFFHIEIREEEFFTMTAKMTGTIEKALHSKGFDVSGVKWG